MFKVVRNILIGAALAVPLLMVGTDAKADPPRVRDRDGYWSNYWGWYDGDYRPYYRRHYGYPRYYYPQYGYYDDDFRFSYNPYYRGFGYYDGYRRSAINVGPLHFSWR